MGCRTTTQTWTARSTRKAMAENTCMDCGHHGREAHIHMHALCISSVVHLGASSEGMPLCSTLLLHERLHGQQTIYEMRCSCHPQASARETMLMLQCCKAWPAIRICLQSGVPGRMARAQGVWKGRVPHTPHNGCWVKAFLYSHKYPTC